MWPEYVDNKFYIFVTGCTHEESCWYKDKIGVMYLVTDEVSSDYGVLDWNFNKRGLFPLIDVRDCKKFEPTNWQRFKHWFGVEVKVKCFDDNHCSAEPFEGSRSRREDRYY